jgi:hypothetical protein
MFLASATLYRLPFIRFLILIHLTVFIRLYSSHHSLVYRLYLDTI